MNKELENWFSDSYDKYFDRIFHYILKRTRDLAIAQDVASETFFKAVRHIKKTQQKIEKIESWLYTIATNEIRQHYRKNKRFFFFSLADSPEIPDYTTPVSQLKAFEKEKEKKQELTELLEKIKKLPELDQEIVALRFLEGKKTEEIANVLGKKASAIRVRLHRLKDKLKGLI